MIWNRRMRTNRCLAIIGLLLFKMVAVQSGTPGGTSTATTSNMETEMNSLSKALVGVTKLNGSNYDVWYAGLLTLLMVGSTLRRVLGTALETFKTNMDKELATIVAAVRTAVSMADTADDAKFKELNSVVFSIVYGTLSDCTETASAKMYGAKKAFGNGFAFLKHLADKFGLAGGTNQVLLAHDIMTEKQHVGESPDDFATRLETLNSDLDTECTDLMLRSILVRGLHDNELKGFLAKEQSSNRTITFHQLVMKIKEYVLMCKVVDSGTDIEARFAGIGPGSSYRLQPAMIKSLSGMGNTIIRIIHNTINNTYYT